MTVDLWFCEACNGTQRVRPGMHPGWCRLCGSHLVIHTGQTDEHGLTPGDYPEPELTLFGEAS